MKVRLLGPVDVEVSGLPTSPGPLQRRAVLAALAVDAGSPVSIDALTTRVWGSQAPDAPRSALYAHIARLRKFFAANDRGERPIRLDRHADGYLLDVERERVDLHRVGALLEAYRASPAPHDDRRVATLRTAMELWRGRPLGNLSGDWVGMMRRRIESQLVGVARAWAAEELRLGNAEAVADRLTPIVAADALAEPVVAALMRALCALGRTSEALQVYAFARAQTADQLGIEPGRELRELHVAVLRGEFDDAYPGGTITVAAPVPRQLPATVERFVGRADELTRIHDRLTAFRQQGSTPVVGIYGAAGVGKSALVIYAAHQLADRYPDGQMYLELRGCSAGSTPLRPMDALARLLRTLGVDPPPDSMHVDEAAALFRSLMAGRRTLLVLDNAADASQVRPLLPSGAGCALLLTSRQPLAGMGDVCQVPLGPLAVDEAVALLGQLGGAQRVAAEPEAAAAIAHWCEYLPVALRIAAARLAARPGWPLAELRDRLADEHRRLDNLEVDGVGLRASIAGSVEQLIDSADPTARAAAAAFTLLGASGEPELSRSTAARLLAQPEPYAERTLERLVDAQLLETSAPGRYKMGDLLRLYARELQATPLGELHPAR
ncbi:MAG TPA: BTAD domain-containing putative transcriptional regulator [Pilimelia sp.]|nr:BTAD domain-containing putative transcriptional regulator [Pilimelia sp.]